MLLLLSVFLCVKVLDMVEVGVIGLREVVFEVVAIFEIGVWLLTGLCEVVVDLVVVESGVDCKVFEGLCLRLWFCLRSGFCLRLVLVLKLQSRLRLEICEMLWLCLRL